MSTVDLVVGSVGALNTLLAASIWFKLGVLQGKLDAGTAPLADRLTSIESRITGLEAKT